MHRIGIRTLLLHSAVNDSDDLVPPVHRSSTYALGEPESFDDIRYIRLNNTPTQRAVEQTLGALEDGVALVTPSGTAGLWLAIASVVQRGDHVLAPARVYGGTRKILDHLVEREGIEVSYVDGMDLRTWESAARPKTRLALTESLSNPWIESPPLDAIASFCRGRGIVSLVDNTIATPVLCQPRKLGFDLVVHSASKALNGHSDVVAGVIVGSKDQTTAARRLANRLGICPDPEACFLLARGLKTLTLRVHEQCRTARALAMELASHPDVERVMHPSLRNLSFIPESTLLTFAPRGGAARAKKLIDVLRWPTEAPSLGGVESLVCRPATTSHAGLPLDLRQAMGVTDELIRVSVGLEDASDLSRDFRNALEATRKASNRNNSCSN